MKYYNKNLENLSFSCIHSREDFSFCLSVLLRKLPISVVLIFLLSLLFILFDVLL
jgi:hypothetical protein